MVHAFHMPSHSFVLGHLRQTSEGVHIVGEVPKLLIFKNEVVRLWESLQIWGRGQGREEPWDD